jgi:signal transduction histidine kinase
MDYGVLNSNTTAANVINFVSTALRQHRLSGVSEILKEIAHAVDAFGCVLWQATPDSKLDAQPPEGSLFVLSQWLEDNSFVALYDLPLKSVSGEAILTQAPVNVHDIFEHPLNVLTPFQRDAGIKTMCSVPITFLDGVRGTVNVYRNVAMPFSSEEVQTVAQFASLVPALYETVRDKVSLDLISSIDEIINKAEFQSRNHTLSLDEIKVVFKAIAEQMGVIFNSLEVSLFLHVNLETPGLYELMATTWPIEIKKTIYSGDKEEGVTAWVLCERKPVKIFDLVNFDRDKEEIAKTYPDIVWCDSLIIEPSARDLLGVNRAAQLPPVSFMAAPIVNGDEVLGVIRCSRVQGGPSYFDDRDLNLLILVAAQVGRYAANWLSRREMQRENESWRALVRSVTKLNQFVQKELMREKPDELRIFEEALKLTSTVIPGAEIMDVRLLNKEGELYFATTRGQAWHEGTEAEINKRRERKFSLSGEVSAGAHVFNTGQLYVVKNSEIDPYYSKTFPFIKRMIVAPISVQREKFGVLDIRAIRESDFPRHAEAIAELLGQQLGLYHYLSNTIGKLREAETGLKANVSSVERMQREQAEAFENLEHQFRSPVILAYARVQSLLNDEQGDAKARSQLQAVRGLCGKAKRVAMSTGLFAKLARQEMLEPTKRPLEYEYLVKVLSETAADHELLTDPVRGIRFRVDRRSYDVLRSVTVEIDHELLEQAINNLLDNAAKYSLPDTRIDVTWGLTRADRFHITVLNKGLQIRAEEVRDCRNRGWRGRLAAVTTGEGSGIGLWIVDNIMQAHNGELVVIPTTANGVTEIKLVFQTQVSRK